MTDQLVARHIRTSSVITQNERNDEQQKREKANNEASDTLNSLSEMMGLRIKLEHVLYKHLGNLQRLQSTLDDTFGSQDSFLNSDNSSGENEDAKPPAKVTNEASK